MKYTPLFLSFAVLAIFAGCGGSAEPEPEPTPKPEPEPTPVVDNPLQIKTASQFVDFLKSATDTTKSTYKLMASIDCKDITLPQAADFAGSFEGQGFVISGLHSNCPLFKNNSGTVRNLVLEGSVSSTTGDLSSLVSVNSGTLDGCVNRASVTLTLSSDQSDSHIVGGLAAFNKGTMSNCTNEGKVSIVSSAKVSGTAIGGIAGYSTGSFSACHNKGEVSFSAASLKALSAIGEVKQSAVSEGGIVGLAYSGFSAKDCSNEAAITYSVTAIDQVAASLGRNQIGGIAGSSCGDINACSNSGRIDVSAKSSNGQAFSTYSYTVCVGGISGGEFYAPGQNCTNIIGCSNSGAINVDTDATDSNSPVGGIVGWPNLESPVENVTKDCTNTGALTIKGLGKVRAGGISGGTGNVDGCKNSGTVTAVASSSKSTIGGISAFHSQTHIIRNCENTGDVISEIALAGASGLIGNRGNAASSTGEGCSVNCKVKNVDSAGSCTGMVVGYWNGTSKAVTLGSVASPIKVSGSICYGSEWKEVKADNWSTLISGSANSTSIHTIITDRSLPTGGEVHGHVLWSDGSPAGGVAVSDGFSVVFTDKQGAYTINANKDAWYIYLSLPSNAKVTRNSNGQPDYFKRYVNGTTEVNFALTKQEVENKFAIFALADPQAHYVARSPQKIADVNRFLQETVPALNERASSIGLPSYGVTLGDVVYSETSRNSNPGMTVMRTNFSKMSIPVFQTMGNHDYTYFYSSSPLTTDLTSSTLYLKAQRNFEDTFATVNSSFKRGKVHIACMRDIIYDSNTDASSYHGGFTDEQYQWLKADLSGVPSDYAVVLCVHIPLVGIGTGYNVSNVLGLLSKFPNSTVFSGHTHYKRGAANICSTSLYEHVHSAVCGQWWWSNVEGDGCPNGYTLYTFEGNKIVNESFFGVNTNMNTKDYQIRMYRGNLKTGGPYAYFQYPHSEKILLINVFNGDGRWKSVKVYENGSFSGNATLMSNSRQNFSSVTKGQTYSITSASSQDWWCIGYHVGVLGRGTSSTSYYTSNFHMYKYTLKDANSSVAVEATDPYGNVYTCNELIEDGTVYPEYISVGNH